jgi:hypothetical protein
MKALAVLHCIPTIGAHLSRMPCHALTLELISGLHFKFSDK